MTREPIPDVIADCMLKGCQNRELRADVERLKAALAGIACWSIDHNDAKARANRALDPKP